MNIEEVLSNYNTYKLKISIKEKEINELKNELYNVKSAILDGMPKPKGYTTSALEDKVIQIEEKIQEKENYISNIKSEIKVVDDLIKVLKKYNQDIIKSKYFLMMSIEEIATNRGRTYWSIQKTIKNSISKMQKKYNEITDKK